jgi:(p)ppGpp synthase/HD superfamily hydrolase
MHHGQLDKSGKAYILHPLAVMLRMDTDEERIVAVLHDVVEDTPITVADLLHDGYPPEIVEAVDLLSRRHNQTYSEYIQALAGNRIALKVKIADLIHNLDPSRAYEGFASVAETRYRPTLIKLLKIQNPDPERYAGQLNKLLGTGVLSRTGARSVING